jgi:uncharacterized protein
MSASTHHPGEDGRRADARLAGVPTLVHVGLFFVITFVGTWALFLPLALKVVSRQSDLGDILSLGIAAPTITAFVVTAIIAGRAGAGDLWRRVVQWRARPAWYALVLVGPALVYGASLAVAAGLSTPLPPMDFSVAAVVSAVIPGLLAGLSEEFGWSGFAFPALQARYGFVWAGVVVGLAVGLWHLPFFFVPGLPHYSASFGLFMLAAIPLRMLFGWIYNGSGRSVLLMILFHGSWNAWADLLSPPLAVPEPAWLTFTLILWEAALIMLRLTRAAGGRATAPVNPPV